MASAKQNNEADKMAAPATVPADDYAAIHAAFTWQVPDHFNIAQVCCGRWAGDPQRIAIRHEEESGASATLTYAQMQAQANRLSNLLRGLGVGAGDRVALILPQCCQTAVAHIACYQLGAVAMPLSVLFGPEALAFRLQDSCAMVAIFDGPASASTPGLRNTCPALAHAICVGGGTGSPGNAIEGGSIDGMLDWDACLASQSEVFTPVATLASDAAILIYTSGTTGAPKGTLLPHAALIGNLSGFVASQNWFPQADDVFWSPADWAWTGGLMDALLPTLYFGREIVGYRGRFSAETAFSLLEKHAVTNTFLFPTALKMMMKAVPLPRQRYDLRLRAIMSAGEAVGDAVFNWGREALGITINEMFGQTEMNYIVGNSAGKWPAKPGSMGRPYPGHRVAVIDDDGNVAAPGTVGDVALHRCDIHGHPDPVFFLGYWNNPQATADKFSGDWCRTGDLAAMDADGYFWYRGRADDMFKAAGYRIGPSEIENCLVRHPAVANAAVVPKPDAQRGNIVKAFVVVAAGRMRDAASDRVLVAELQDLVRARLAPYEYPKEIEFVDSLPMTTTGKVQRRVLRLLEESRAERDAVPE